MPCDAKMRLLDGRCLILTCSKDKIKKQVLEQAGFEVFVLAERKGRLDLKTVFLFLAKQQINEVLVEAGAATNLKRDTFNFKVE
ncbi:MAG: hypothetical protein Q9M50_09885 [Methylococcales bacterium]|nr:hypothetical protein [Methylococcales bacterium]